MLSRIMSHDSLFHRKKVVVVKYMKLHKSDLFQTEKHSMLLIFLFQSCKRQALLQKFYMPCFTLQNIMLNRTESQDILFQVVQFAPSFPATFISPHILFLRFGLFVLQSLLFINGSQFPYSLFLLLRGRWWNIIGRINNCLSPRRI